MAEKRFFKGLKIVGKYFCMYDVSKRGYFIVYRFEGVTYFKPRYQAIKGQTINQVSNLVKCKPFELGKITGFIETD
jgi:hypothetical protein